MSSNKLVDERSDGRYKLTLNRVEEPLLPSIVFVSLLSILTSHLLFQIECHRYVCINQSKNEQYGTHY